MKTDMGFKEKDLLINKMYEELNELLALEDDIQQKINDKVEAISTLRTQLKKYDSTYKTEMEKIKWIPAQEIQYKTSL
jgi:predicted  nucleic acid-binding Zn-ribbon protein